MKKFKIMAYILLIVIIVVLSITIYSNATKDDSKEEKEKIVSEIEYFESKFIDLLNSMNNIEYRNYNVESSNISTKENTEKNQQNENQQSQGGESGQSSSEQGQEGGQSSGSSSGGEAQGMNSSGSEGGNSPSGGSTSTQNTEGNSQQDGTRYELKSGGVLLSSQEINWDDAKNQIEILYSSIPGFTLDLYQLKVNQEDILSFNKEFDNLSVAAKEENKENTLASLAKLYSYIPKFFNETEGDKVKGNLIEIKSYVFNAYSKLDSDDWETIKTNINSASNLYSNLLTNVEIKSNDQYNINKGYVLLNEINNAIELKDVSIFLIKYKNLLEQIGNI